MNIYLGTDIVYVPRIQVMLDRFGSRFVQRVYTSGEQEDCEQLDSQQSNANGKIRKDLCRRLAGRWAAKEAVAKALGTGWRGIRYRDIEIRRLPNGAPQVCLHGAAAARVATWGDCRWQLSLSHDGDYCVATAIALCT